ncbi:MAG: hypothetical protein ACD_49C00051G0022 [uncultured bacterium (gcode 4)]|uniref:Uncharacterized protein n=1 Tax=uncultured bacterium (gcode 4) TaxID=1234023 RepID=K2BBZ9_9BACT|nr:MAG: hypothetical protein ACD_49C00051G0022 [uncultured bacterium (gcode 4)]
MKKLLIITFSIFLLISCGKSDTGNNWEGTKQEEVAVSMTKEEKVAQLKNRLNFRSFITKWDFYSIKNMKEVALKYYLSVYSKLKKDILLEKKIAETYFDLKNFPKSYEYYKKIPKMEVDETSKWKMALALTYMTGEIDKKSELNNIELTSDNKTYYSIVSDCYGGIKVCIGAIKSYTWTYEKTNKLKNLLYNFEQTWNADSNYKYALLAGAYIENKDYLIWARIWEEILRKRPDYKSILKLTGYAYYELGDYKKANDYLQKYYNFDPKDVKTTYLLWVINFYLENYISSNLYFNAAILNWYTPKVELERRLAYNYYIIGDKRNMFKVFRYLLDEKWVDEDDYSVAIFTAIEDKESSKSMLWANKWIIKFPNSSNMYAFRWWIYRVRNELENALQDLEKSLSLNPSNPVALYNKWMIFEERQNYLLAKKYFLDTIENDKNWTFWNQADIELKNIEKIEKQTLTWSTLDNN